MNASWIVLDEPLLLSQLVSRVDLFHLMLHLLSSSHIIELVRVHHLRMAFCELRGLHYSIVTDFII